MSWLGRVGLFFGLAPWMVVLFLFPILLFTVLVVFLAVWGNDIAVHNFIRDWLRNVNGAIK